MKTSSNCPILPDADSTRDTPPYSPRGRETLIQRGMAAVPEDFLLVDFYRIRRRMALRLPLKAMPALPPKVGAIEPYPWLLWIMWKVESRIISLAAAAENNPDGRAPAILHRDLHSLCQWNPEAVILTGHPLAGAHLLRCLTYLLDRSPAHAPLISKSIHNLLSACKGMLGERWGAFRQEESTGATWPKPYYNINCIPLFSMAFAARRTNHPLCEEIEALANATMTSLAEARQVGWTEGWSYDAYVQDFLADWLLAAPDIEAQGVYGALRPSLLEPFHIDCPGEGFQPPILADSECPEMHFHWSAAVKWFALSDDHDLLQGVNSAKLEDVSSDALLWWPTETVAQRAGQTPRTTPNAVVLHRDGPPDVIVTAGAANCQNGHLHADRGHICIGSDACWVVQDPGYRQYLRTSEHQFATGVASHNAPVINGQAQSLEGMRVVPLKWTRPELTPSNSATFHLGNLYPVELGLTAVTRKIKVAENIHIEDSLAGAHPAYTVSYFWHFHPEAYLGEENGALVIVVGRQVWTVRCSELSLSLRLVSRLRGSRGQQTLSVELSAKSDQIIQWDFAQV